MVRTMLFYWKLIYDSCKGIPTSSSARVCTCSLLQDLQPFSDKVDTWQNSFNASKTAHVLFRWRHRDRRHTTSPQERRRRGTEGSSNLGRWVRENFFCKLGLKWANFDLSRSKFQVSPICSAMSNHLFMQILPPTQLETYTSSSWS